MTEKRYFKREWGEEFYIFDSQVISEKEFDEKVQYEDYQAFIDSMRADEVVDLLNTFHDENQQLRQLLEDGLDVSQGEINEELRRMKKELLE